MLGTRYKFLPTRKVIGGQKRYRTNINLEKSHFFVEFFFDIFLGFDPILLNLGHVGTRYEFLPMRKVISGRNQYRNTYNLEKNDFFVEIFFQHFS